MKELIVVGIGIAGLLITSLALAKAVIEKMKER